MDSLKAAEDQLGRTFEGEDKDSEAKEDKEVDEAADDGEKTEDLPPKVEAKPDEDGEDSNKLGV